LDFFSVSFHLPAIASSSEAGGDEVDRKQFAYGEGKMSSLEEILCFLPFCSLSRRAEKYNILIIQ